MTGTCEHCTHDWHGLVCHHEAVVRDGWWLTRETCRCRGVSLAATADPAQWGHA